MPPPYAVSRGSKLPIHSSRCMENESINLQNLLNWLASGPFSMRLVLGRAPQPLPTARRLIHTPSEHVVRAVRHTTDLQNRRRHAFLGCGAMLHPPFNHFKITLASSARSELRFIGLIDPQAGNQVAKLSNPNSSLSRSLFRDSGLPRTLCQVIWHPTQPVEWRLCAMSRPKSGLMMSFGHATSFCTPEAPLSTHFWDWNPDK